MLLAATEDTKSRLHTLPLLDHALELVVQDENFDTNVVLCSGGEFHGSHTE